MISIVTTCKNRLSHLQQSLPSLLQQSLTEVIVVDYGCEQGTADWVKKTYPAVKILEINDDPTFCVARARNLGAKRANNPILAFVDADIIVNSDLASWIRHPPTEPLYYANLPGTWECGGFIVCRADSFNEIGGFDEAFRGWGHEDTDFIERLGMAGYRRVDIPSNFFTVIHHSNNMRQVGAGTGGFQTLLQAYYLGEFYRRIKTDMVNLTGHPIPLPTRTDLMRAIKSEFERACQAENTELVLSVAIEQTTFANHVIETESELIYRLKIDHLRSG